MDSDRRRVDPALKAEATRLRSLGWTYAAIGLHFGRDQTTVHRWVRGEPDGRRAQVRDAVTKVREANRAAGRCACGGIRAPKRKSCLRCLELGRERNKRPSVYPRQRARYRRLRDAALAAYGGKCACCGETERAFLTLDHVNRDGAAHRRELGGRTIETWLAHEGYPEGFQILCWNCNIGRERNGGVCPHEESRGDVRQLRAV